MATTTDDGFHEIHLNGKQLVFLFMAVTVVSVVIFLCGVLVGRGVRATSPADAIAGLSATELPPAPDPGAAAPQSGTPATAGEPLSYPDRLASNAPVNEKLREGNAPPAAQPAQPTPPAASAPAPAAPAPTTTAQATPPPAPANAKPTTPAPAPAKPVPAPEPPKPAPATAVATEPAGAGFAIQVAALKERNEAETIVKRLSGKGYSAYVLAPSSGTPTMYRVRVGKFKERREADAVAARLQKEEQFKPWIVR
jgi:DedD protein